MTDRQLFKETFSQLHASEDTITEVMNMAREQDNKRDFRKPVRMGAILALAAVLLMGSAFAAVGYKLRTDRVGDLAVAVSVAEEGSQPGAVAFSGEAAAVDYYDLDFSAGWLPEGIVNVPGETTKWDWEEDGWRGGFSLTGSPLNVGNATFCDVVPDAERQESLSVNGHDAFYIKMTGDNGFNQRMYVSYPEYNAVLTIYIGANVDYDTAVKFAENLEVSASGRPISSENLEYAGKVYADTANYIATGVYVDTADEDAYPEDEDVEFVSLASQAAAEGMVNEKRLGESFTIRALDRRGVDDVPLVDVTVKVTDVRMGEDTSIFRDPSYLDGGVARLLDGNGKLPEDTLRFVTFGDGVSTPLQTVVAEQTQQPRFVAVTVDYTNDTDETIRDIVFRGQLMAVEETENGWEEYKPMPANGAAYDDFFGESWETLEEMRYLDVRDTESNGGNHIVDLEPGETVTIQMGFVVNECQADHLWFILNSGMDDVSEGYVDLRP